MKILALLICSIIAVSLSGCVLSGAIINVNEQRDNLDVIHAASIDKNKLTIDYTVRRSRVRLSRTVQTDVRKCSTYVINKAEVPFDSRYDDQGIMVVPSKDTLFKSIPDINDKDNKIVFDGMVRLSSCSNLSQRLKSENQVNFLVSQVTGSNNFRKVSTYEETSFTSPYFFFKYKIDDKNEVHLVVLESPSRPYYPWYGPILTLFLPVAFVVDVVTFPIELIIFPDAFRM